MSQVILFPRSHQATAFAAAARHEAGAHNLELKDFTQSELVRLATLTERPLAIGLITHSRYFQSTSGVTIQGYNRQNPAEVKFSLYKDAPEKGYIRYFGFIPLLNDKILIETRNSDDAFAQFAHGLNEACYEHEILYDKKPLPFSTLTC